MLVKVISESMVDVCATLFLLLTMKLARTPRSPLPHSLDCPYMDSLPAHAVHSLALEGTRILSRQALYVRGVDLQMEFESAALVPAAVVVIVVVVAVVVAAAV